MKIPNKQKRLLTLLRDIERKGDKLRKVFGDSQFLDEEISQLWGIIMIEYGIDENQNRLSEEDPCEVLGDFGMGDIQMKETHDKLNTIHSEQHMSGGEEL